MNRAAVIRLDCSRGEDVTFTGTHQKAADDPSPKNITGWTGQVVITNPDGTAFATQPWTVVSGPDGTYRWSLLHTQTNVLASVKAVEVWRTDAGAEELMARGTLTIENDKRYGT